MKRSVSRRESVDGPAFAGIAAFRHPPTIFLSGVGVLFLILAGFGSAFAQEYSVGPPPDWVVTIPIEEPDEIPEEAVADGIDYLLVDTQSYPKAATPEFFAHYARKVVNRDGVSRVSRVSIDFDPSYQSLVVHGISVHRDGSVLDKLDSDNITVLHREVGLEAQILDGMKTFNAILDDVRVGDIVEYAFTVRGANPVLEGAHYAEVGTRWSIPVRRFSDRLLWPDGTPIFTKSHRDGTQPAVRKLDGLVEYTISGEDVPAIVADSDLPSWYSPYPWFQYSEARSWSDVAEWGARLYAIPDELSPELEAEIRKIAKKTAEPEERVVEALRFVQEEIRYMGIEIGPSSYRPHDPAEVFERRFGDCKDKAFLLCTMLDSMGIGSRPALVNPYLLRSTEEWLPTPFAFTHVITLVNIDGRDYWLDPTLTGQRGTLEHIHQPDYEVAFVLDPETGGLTRMKTNRPLLPEQIVHESFDLAKDSDEPAGLVIRTEYRGSAADRTRRMLSQESREELEKSYVNFYASVYPDIAMAKPIEVDDNEKTNVLTVTETYEIPGIWEEGEDGTTTEALFEPVELYDLIDTPLTRQRTMPLGVDHPTRFRLTTEVLLPDDWTIEPDTFHVEDDAIAFDYRIGYRPRCLTLDYDYRTKQDFVPVEKSQEHIANLERIEKKLGYIVYTSAGTETSWLHEINWSVGLIALFVFAASFFLARKVYLYDPEPDGPVLPDARYEKFGGFLLLIALIVLVQPISLIVNLCSTYDAYTLTRWHYLTSPGSEGYNPLWQPVLILELVFNILLAVFSVLMAVLFLQKRHTFPRIYTAYILISFLLTTVDGLAARLIPGLNEEGILEFSSGTFGAMIVVGLYALYLRSSQRVENTFVRTRRGGLQEA